MMGVPRVPLRRPISSSPSTRGRSPRHGNRSALVQVSMSPLASPHQQQQCLRMQYSVDDSHLSFYPQQQIDQNLLPNSVKPNAHMFQASPNSKHDSALSCELVSTSRLFSREFVAGNYSGLMVAASSIVFCILSSESVNQCR